MNRSLRTLEELTHRCEIEQPKMPVASVTDVLGLLETFALQYDLDRHDRHAFLRQIGKLNSLVRAKTIDAWDAAEALYVLHQSLWAAEAAAGARKDGSVVPEYRPVGQILDIATALPSRLAAIPKQDRPAFFHKLYETCRMLPSDGHAGFSNPVGYISDIAQALNT
jgi:hypothetical protein